jgi:hypothetical protein
MRPLRGNWRGKPRGWNSGAYLLLAVALTACCGSDTGGTPSSPDPSLGPAPVPVSPIDGAQVTTDTPVFTVRNARGFDSGQGQYLFEVITLGKGTVVASGTVPAGHSTTTASFAVPRGMSLAWRATAIGPASQVASATALFKMPAVSCQPLGDGWAKAVVDVLLPFCAQMPNIYNDPNDVLGPYDAGGFGPNNFFGFLSLGEEGHVTVDMEACATDLSGNDLRVFQAVGSEPVTVYAGGTATGPWILLGADARCGTRIPGTQTTRFCDFDLGAGEVQEARFFKIVDAERFPCEQAGTPSEGADIDAVRILQAGP